MFETLLKQIWNNVHQKYFFIMVLEKYIIMIVLKTLCMCVSIVLWIPNTYIFYINYISRYTEQNMENILGIKILFVFCSYSTRGNSISVFHLLFFLCLLYTYSLWNVMVWKGVKQINWENKFALTWSQEKFSMKVTIEFSFTRIYLTIDSHLVLFIYT